MKKTIILSTIIGSLFFMSCTEDSVNPTNPTNSDIPVERTLSEQVQGTWNQVSLTVTPAVKIGDLETNNPYDFMSDCQKDDLIILKSDNHLERNQGALTCKDDDMIPAASSWELHDDRKTIILDGQKYQILDVQDKAIRLAYEQTIDQEIHTFTTTFARK
jgi:hypothetical protein